MREINIGVQDFEEIREHGDFYIDKTDFIREWWESRDTVTLITRPRRFGKTLNLRMVECFFSNRYAGRKDLFEGLDIWKEEKYRELQGTYPVIFLSFADVKERTFPEARRSIILSLQNVFHQFEAIWKNGKNGKTDEASFHAYSHTFSKINPDSPDADVARSLQQLSYFLSEYYGKRVLIFLDEYDTPLQEAFVNGYWDDMLAMIRSLFNSTFKTNPALERAIMTGITRVSRESIFSDLNNLNVVTTTGEQYETAFGFTEGEVKASLTEFGLADRFGEIKKWYDGFTFGNVQDIYNPWSIINFLKRRKLAPYWANTSSNGLISYELRISDNRIKDQMTELMNGGAIRASIDEQVVFSQLEGNAGAMWSLFLASGYLKVQKAEFDGSFDFYTMSLTNHEVMVMFRSLIREWFDPAADSFSRFTQALQTGNTEWLNYYLNDLLLNVAGSFDTRKKVLPGHEPESFYHGLVLGLVAAEQDYIVTSNRESGLGRYDVVMRPRIFDHNPVNRQKENLNGQKVYMPAILIEFKVYDPEREKTLSETADRALRQITDRRYDAALLQEGISQENIIHYGMAFRGKEALVKKGG